jgi:uncharacterized protein (TIGR02186 family)
MRPLGLGGRLLCLYAAAWAMSPVTVCAALDETPRAAIQLVPNEVEANLFFHGSEVEVQGTVLPGYEVAVVCRGKASHLALRRKGKVWGVLWMNVGDVAFDDIPSLYLVSTSAPLASLAPAAVLEQLGIGYPALAALAGQGGEEQPFFQELVKIKEKEGIFAVREGAVKLLPGAGGIRQVRAECALPSTVPMEGYEVQLFGFKEGTGELLCSKAMEVRQVGVAHFMSSLVQSHPLLHGFFAVIVAVAAGLLTGLVFGGSSKKGH